MTVTPATPMAPQSRAVVAVMDGNGRSAGASPHFSASLASLRLAQGAEFDIWTLVQYTGGVSREVSMEELTDRQEQLLRFIQEQVEMRGFPPSIREMAEYMGIRSTNGVNDHLKALRRKGFISREAVLKSRAISLTRKAGAHSRAGGEPLVAVPILGRVAAGTPILAQENIEGTLPIGRSFLPAGEGVFALRVRGESMIGHGILDDDLVLVRSQNSAQPGQVVVALLEGEATVKIFKPGKDVIRFEPANPAMEAIVVSRDDFRQTDILGVVVGLYRQIS